MDHFDETTEEFDYIICAEVDPLGELPEGMVSYAIPRQTYSVFKCTLPTIRDVCRHAYREWLPSSEYNRAPGPEYELYAEEFHIDQTLHIYIPVSAK